MKTLGCIGCGNMGGAVLKGLASCAQQSVQLQGYDHTRSKVESLNQGCNRILWAGSEKEIIENSDYVLIAIKPQHLDSLYPVLRETLSPKKTLLSMAAATDISTLRRMTGDICPVIRLMPNLPALIGKGITAICLEDDRLAEEEKQFIVRLFSPLGETLVLPEKQFPAFSAVAGCGPAYVDLFMEGMMQAAISLGFKSDQAKKIVAATVEGSAAMAASLPVSFADLRTQVCSPAGMTIYAVNHLERTAVRGHVADAVLAAYERDRIMSKK